jgi:hypothetical protein
MKLFIRVFFCLSLFCGMAVHVSAQKKNVSYINYIDQYKDLAIKEMNRYKVPASITLAQGLLESGAGLSDLALSGNNHFGIKCHSDWTGERIYRRDDNPNDCFRKYKKVEDSYKDHSTFLAEQPRYAGLFAYDLTDYPAWAKGLQKSGYATDKSYANKLVTMIELYELYQYDSNKKRKSDKTKQKFDIPKRMRPTYIAVGLLYVEAEDEDSFEKIAYDMDFKLKNLLKYNDVHEGFPLQKGDVVYLEKKKSKADIPNFDYIVKVGDSMHSISQHYGIKLKSLYKLNKKKNDYIPEEGDVLRLR